MIVEEYVREDGSCLFRGWFDDLDVQAAANVATAIVRVGLGTLSNVKWIGGGLGEYRIGWGTGLPPLCHPRWGSVDHHLRGRDQEAAAV